MKTTSLLILLFWTAAAAAQDVPSVSVHCASDAERRHCAADTHAGVLLVRSTGPAACLLGRTWGYDADGVWVTEGCGAEFLVAGTPRAAATAVAAEHPPAAPNPPQQPGGDAEFSFYARFGSITSFTNGEVDVEDNGSRLAFEFSRGDAVRFFAKGEWSVNLTGARTTLNPGESTSSGYITLDSVSDEVLGARLGYVGVDFGDIGTLTLGKQWGVHYDIAGYTDIFNTFGAEASATFNAGTDGGLTGTGRADGALLYRNTFFDRVDVGMQLQFRSIDNDQFLDGHGLSLRARLWSGVEAGIAHTRARLQPSLRPAVSGLDGDPEYWIAGFKYEGDALTLAGIYSHQRNGDLARVPVEEAGNIFLIPDVFDADGLEISARYQVGTVGLLAGFQDYDPTFKPDNEFIDPETRRRYYVAGIDYFPTPRVRLYAEYRLSESITALGEPGEDVFVLGAKYEFLSDGLGD
jgi:predicted porin